MDETPKPLLEHLLELRKRLLISVVVFLIAFAGCYFFAESIFHFLAKPLTSLLQTRGERRMIFTGVTEAFLTYLKVAGFAGAVIAFPVIANQLWLFIAPGLYRHERQVFIAFSVATPLLFILGAAFAYYVVCPNAYAFFLSFEAPGANGMVPLVLEPKINEYLGFVMRLILAFGVCFELPVLLTLLAYVGLITSTFLIQKWRLSVVLIFVVAAFITPPDILSMLALALPLITLYGLSVLMVKAVERRAKERNDVRYQMDTPES